MHGPPYVNSKMCVAKICKLPGQNIRKCGFGHFLCILTHLTPWGLQNNLLQCIEYWISVHI